MLFARHIVSALTLRLGRSLSHGAIIIVARHVTEKYGVMVLLLYRR